MTTVDSWPKTLPMLSVGSWNSTTETHLLHRGAFCQFPFRWIYYCHSSSKSTGKETGKTQNSAVVYRADILTIFRSYFGRNDDFINSFWSLLTFTHIFERLCIFLDLLEKNLEIFFSEVFKQLRPVSAFYFCSLQRKLASSWESYKLFKA